MIELILFVVMIATLVAIKWSSPGFFAIGDSTYKKLETAIERSSHARELEEVSFRPDSDGRELVVTATLPALESGALTYRASVDHWQVDVGELIWNRTNEKGECIDRRERGSYTDLTLERPLDMILAQCAPDVLGTEAMIKFDVAAHAVSTSWPPSLLHNSIGLADAARRTRALAARLRQHRGALAVNLWCEIDPSARVSSSALLAIARAVVAEARGDRGALARLRTDAERGADRRALALVEALPREAREVLPLERLVHLANVSATALGDYARAHLNPGVQPFGAALALRLADLFPGDGSMSDASGLSAQTRAYSFAARAARDLGSYPIQDQKIRAAARSFSLVATSLPARIAVDVIPYSPTLGWLECALEGARLIERAGTVLFRFDESGRWLAHLWSRIVQKHGTFQISQLPEVDDALSGALAAYARSPIVGHPAQHLLNPDLELASIGGTRTLAVLRTLSQTGAPGSDVARAACEALYERLRAERGDLGGKLSMASGEGGALTLSESDRSSSCAVARARTRGELTSL